MSLEKLHEQGETLRRLLMLPTYPLAVRLYRDIVEFPAETRCPGDFRGRRWAICQAWGLSRKIGWTIGLTPHSSFCVPASILFGWAELENEEDLVNTWFEMGIAESVEGVKRYLKEHCWFEKGEYAGLVFSPLPWTKVEPDIVLVFCNPAQAGVLIAAYVYKEGKSLTSTSRSTAVCASCIIGTMKDDEPTLSIICAGARGLEMCDDSELILAFPGAMLGDMVDGLEANRKHGYNRIPVPPYLIFEPDPIPPYAKLKKKLKIVK